MTLSRIYHQEKIQELGLQALIAFVKAIAVDRLQNDEVLAVYDELDEPIFNVVMDAPTTPERLDEVLSAVISFYQKHQTTWSWIIGPLTKPEPSILEVYLKHHDLFKTETYPGMYFDLEKVIPESSVVDLEIREANANLEEWIVPISAAFPPSKDHGEGFRKLHANIAHGIGTAFRHYVGYCHNKPVCAGTLFLQEELAMIHNIATHPAFQRRQFGTAIVTHALQDAKNAGAKHCFLDASEKGKNVYSRLGFDEYCMQSIYRLKPV